MLRKLCTGQMKKVFFAVLVAWGGLTIAIPTIAQASSNEELQEIGVIKDDGVDGRCVVICQLVKIKYLVVA